MFYGTNIRTYNRRNKNKSLKLIHLLDGLNLRLSLFRLSTTHQPWLRMKVNGVGELLSEYSSSPSARMKHDMPTLPYSTSPVVSEYTRIPEFSSVTNLVAWPEKIGKGLMFISLNVEREAQIAALDALRAELEASRSRDCCNHRKNRESQQGRFPGSARLLPEVSIHPESPRSSWEQSWSE
jgi:hypothetical protein